MHTCTMAQKRYSAVIFGNGNLIMGDDGFGPAVIEEFNTQYFLPDSVATVDAGTCVWEHLFDYLLSPEGRPERVIVLDAVDCQGRKPEEVYRIDASSIPSKKIHDFSLHQFPTVNLLHEIEEHTTIRVDILVAQVEYIPDEIEPGLSLSMKSAIPVACEKILQILSVKS